MMNFLCGLKKLYQVDFDRWKFLMVFWEDFLLINDYENGKIKKNLDYISYQANLLHFLFENIKIINLELSWVIWKICWKFSLIQSVVEAAEFHIYSWKESEKFYWIRIEENWTVVKEESQKERQWENRVKKWKIVTSI
jgi:hypothetical protein